MFLILTGLAVKSTVVFAVAWIAAFLLRNRSAAARHMVWTAAAASVLALPILSLSIPVVRVPVPDSAGVVFRATADAPAPVANTHLIARPSSVSKGAGTWAPDWRLWLMFLWAAGAAAGLARILAGFFAVWSIRRSAHSGADNHLSPVRIFETSSAGVPMTTGIFRPVIYMPRNAVEWSEERRRAVLMHELAHVERRDAATHLVARIAVALYWWNPLAWIAWRGFLQEQERSADDVVLNQGVRPSDYAGHLLEIARSMHGGHAWAVSMARHSRLEGRLSSILDAGVNRKSPGRGAAWFAALITVGFVAPLAALHAQDTEPIIRAATSQKNYVMLDNAAKAAENLTQYETAHTLLESAAAIRADVSGAASADYAAGLIKLGDLETRRNNYDSAKDFYTRAVQILGDRPEAGHALIALGVSALIAKNPAEAANDFERARNIDPDDAGIALMWQAIAGPKNATEAEALYRSAMAAANPKSPDAMIIMKVFSRFLRIQDRLQEAVELEARADVLQKANAAPRPEPRNGVYRVGGGVTAPSLISKVDPEYSAEARLIKYSGTVALALEVGPDGMAHNVAIVRSLGVGLDEKALEAIQQWRFKPGEKDGLPVTVLATIEVNFKLL